MGNETSSVKLHQLLSADDVKNIRTSFPGGGSGEKQSLYIIILDLTILCLVYDRGITH